MKRQLKILVPVDNSDFSNEILKAVSSRDWQRGTQIRILSVIQPAIEAYITEQCVKHCEIVLNDRVKAMVETLPECEVIGECIEGSPDSTILEVAKEWDADLIVIGSHGDTGPRATHIGSVAAAVVNRAPCSVAVVKLKKRARSAALEASSTGAAQ